MNRHALRILLIVLLPLGQPAARGDERLGVVEGQARFPETGTPASGATIDFFHREDSGWSVVADKDGRFRWTLPGREVVWFRNVGEPGPPCGVMIQDAGSWSWEIVGADAAHRPNEFVSKDCYRKLRKPATSRWEVVDGKPRLIVECPAAGYVKVVVRGPDGAALADRPVRVYPAEAPLEFRGDANVEFRGRTDAGGTFHLRWFEGMRRLRVLVPEVGFGTTGAFEILASRTASADLPPLARFAKVQGTLDSKPAEPGMIVDRLPDRMSPRPWARGQSPVDDQGRFVLRDMIPGTFVLAAGRPGPNAFPYANSVRVRAEPGQVIRGLVIRPPLPPGVPPAGAQPRPQVSPPRSGVGKENVVWVEGTVRDPAGRALTGADVIVHTSFHGGIRMYEQFQETATDAHGRYQINGPLLESMTPLIVVVRAKGRPPAVAYAAAPSAAKSEVGPLDVTLADAGASGSVRVRVLKDGRPRSDVNVALSSEGVIALDMWARQNKAPAAWTEIQPSFYPQSRTGADGVAHFANVFPGTYEVIASEGPPGSPADARRWRADSPREYALAQGVGLSAGQEVETTIALHAIALAVPLQILYPDGTLVAGQDVSYGFGLRSPGSNTSLKLDARGIGSRAFEEPGLWAVDVRFRDSPLFSFPVYEEPFYQAEALLPVSPGFPLPDPVRLKGGLREPGSLRVELRDIDGKPARGAVMSMSTFGGARQVDQGAGTDAGGVVRFADLARGRYTLHGSIDGLAPPFIPAPGPMPDDTALSDQMVFVDQTVEVEAGVEAQVVLQPKKVGYVRGTLRPAMGRSLSEYRVYSDHDASVLAAEHRLDEKTGEFVAGPFLPGPVKVRMFRTSEDGQVQEAGVEDVEVPAGTAARVELRPHDGPAPATARDGTAQVSLGMGGLHFLNEVPRGAGGTVWLADGKTPVFGARGVLLAPGLAQPLASAVSDAAGNLTWRGRWVSAQAKPQAGAPVSKPKAVVWMPGHCGAAVVEVEPGRPVRAVLPAPIDVKGEVTLGGRPSAGVNARLRIVAGHQGLGDADAALSLATSADALGHFTLRGITPGRYKVQAARDGIWLSPSVTLVVEAGKPPAHLPLDIAEPGATIALELVDHAGRPLPRRPLTLERPEGPLAALWPTGFRSDHEGRLTLRGLETGTHSLRIGGERTPRSLQVPEARGKARAPDVVRFVCDDAP